MSGPRADRPRVRRWALVEEGYCIRCRGPIPGDPEQPLCRGCEGAGGSGDEEERGGTFCLACGASAPTSSADPVCAACRERLYA